MEKQMSFKTIALQLSTFTLLATASFAKAAAPQADLSVALVPPSSEMVYSANSYSVTVSNIGKKDASGVVLSMDFPLTHTSPQVFLLGSITQLDSRCAIQAGRVSCALGNLLRGKSTSVAFKYSIPVSNQSIQIKSNVVSNSGDDNPSNNNHTYVPNLTYRSFAIAGPRTATNSHCTGTDLTSYFECTKFPSSISQHSAVLEANGTISFPNEPTYYGFWQQSANETHKLSFQYWEAGNKILEFSGFGSVANCFDGMTAFFPASSYVSAYRVCF